MSIPGFCAELSLIKSRRPHNPAAGQREVSLAQSLVIPQARQVGPGGNIVQYCWNNECYLFQCDETGCHPLSFSSF